ncbi:uncharacterized protein LOC131158272 [Malania oleifera]|uniref:uncharacterized protein LOC131158272 n=1 Tax=Malania oleifera TaxID=397392 RepID=UPI0025AE6E68|nr:uncharacterized protein LOC131158272 [Malania oleifera]
MGKMNIASNAIVPEKLTEDNYEYWKACLKCYLVGKGLWHVVSGKEAKPDKTDDKYEIWKKKNALALHAIQTSCGPNVFDRIKKTTSAIEAWNELAEKLERPSPLPPPDDEEGPVEDTETKEFLQYEALWKAVESGDWKEAKSFLSQHPEALSARISSKADTALHAAILAGQTKIAEELVEMMQPQDLEPTNEFGATVLSLATIGGNIKLAKAILEKNPKLITLGNYVKDDGLIPVVVAALYGKKEMARYLYKVTPILELSPERGVNGAQLLNCLITAEIYDIASKLLREYPQLGVTEDNYGNYTVGILAQKPSAFPSGNKLVFWKRWIYSSCAHLASLDASKDSEISFQIQKDEESGETIPQKRQSRAVNITNQVLGFSRGLVWSLVKCLVPDIMHIYDRKLINDEALKILACIFKELPKLSESKLQKIDIDQAIYDAIKHGIVEFIVEIIKYNPDIIWRKDKKGRSIFANAIVERQENIFCLIYGLGTKKSIIARRHDKFANNFLHLAAKLSPSSQLDRVSGAAMQMQRELQWFKEVERLVLPKYKEEGNDHNKTPGALFSDEHSALMKEGERWMKNTAASSMVVATLIAAVMFTTTFTLPGGTNNDGIPIFLGYDAFMVFIVSNALSLFSSSTSVLMFLGILTSRYAEEDFLKRLPTKLVIGLSSLFFSIVSMMVAFGCALFIILHERLTWVSIPIIVLAVIPITLFAMLEFPLLIDMFANTYGRGIFKKQTKGPY